MSLFTDSAYFAPHGHCFQWTPELLYGMLAADIGIAAAYYAIPAGLFVYARKRQSPQVTRLAWLFGTFIVLCGTSHLIAAWNLWHTDYTIEVISKLATALISIYVAIYLWRSIPQALRIPGNEELQAKNAALTASEARYKELFETANEGIWLLDCEGNTLLANQAMANMLKTDVDRLIGTNLMRFVPEALTEYVRDNMRKRLSGEKEKHEFEFLCADGTTIHTLISTTPTRDIHGEINGMLGIVSDRTEINRAMQRMELLNQELEARVEERTEELNENNVLLRREIAVREEVNQRLVNSQQRLTAVFKASPSGIIVTDKGGVITDLNPAVEAMFGYEREELLGQHVNLLVPEEFRQAHSEYIANASDVIKVKYLGAGRQLVALRKFDVEFPVEVALTNIGHSDESYYMALIRDVSDRVNADNEIRSINERLMGTLDSLKRHYDHMQALNDYSDMLQACKDMPETEEVIRAYSKALFGARDCDIFLLGEDETLRHILSVNGYGDVPNPETRKPGPGISAPLFQRDDCWALKQNRMYPMTLSQQSIACPHITTNSNTLCLPLAAKGQHLGLVVLAMPDSWSVASNDEQFRQLVVAFADHTAITLVNLQLMKEMRQQSFQDELTGLYNRRFILEALRKYRARAVRDTEDLSVMLIDIDHFKQINDDFGHDVGDEVLQKVAFAMTACTRDSDYVARFGGEEFLLVLWNADIRQAEQKAAGIHKTIAGIRHLPRKVTVSVGAAQFKGGDDSISQLIKRADEALYAAKEAGRNQTKAYSDD